MKRVLFISKFEPQVYAILRVVTGFLFLWHGFQKFFLYPPLPPGIVIPVYIIVVGGTIEFFGGILVMTGFLTRWAAFICSGEMAFAYWVGHGTHALLPIVNYGEIAMLYCFLFLFISAYGSGIFSIDRYLQKKRKSP